MKHSPLTTKSLRMIQERNLDHPDAMTLLREIKRLHGILHNCWQALDTIPQDLPSSPVAMLAGLVNNEPCVIEQRAHYARAGEMSNVRPNQAGFGS